MISMRERMDYEAAEREDRRLWRQSQRGGRRELTPDVLRRAEALRAEGASIRDIARALRVPRSTLDRALRARWTS